MTWYMSTYFSGAQHLGGGYCHNPFLELSSHLVIPTSSPLDLLHNPLLGLHKAKLIGSDHTYQVHGPLPVCSPKSQQNLVRMPPHSLGDVDAFWDDMPITPLSPPWIQVMLIGSNHTWPGPMGLPSCIQILARPWLECTPMAWGHGCLLRSCGHHVMIGKPCTTQAT